MPDLKLRKHRRIRRRINWTTVGVITPVILAIVGWGISIESRLGKYESSLELSQRVKNLEDAMLPLLVDWKVEQELKKRLPEPPKPVSTTAKLTDDVKKKADSWARSQLRLEK